MKCILLSTQMVNSLSYYEANFTKDMNDQTTEIYVSDEGGLKTSNICAISFLIYFVCLFVCFVALRPKSTAKVMVGRSVHLTTLFSWASLNKPLTSTSCTYFRL